MLDNDDLWYQFGADSSVYQEIEEVNHLISNQFVLTENG